MTIELHDWRKLTREQQVIVYTICTLDELRDDGFIRGGHVRSSTKAREAFEEMKAEAFAPTPEEITHALTTIEEHAERSLLQLVQNKADGHDESTAHKNTGEHSR